MRIVPELSYVFLSFSGMVLCLVTTDMSQEIIKSLGELTKCLRSAQALQRDPDNEKKMLRFHEVCEMFMKDLDLSPSQQKTLEYIEKRKNEMKNDKENLNVNPISKKNLQEIDSVPEIENIIVDPTDLHQRPTMRNVENSLENNAYYPPGMDAPLSDTRSEKINLLKPNPSVSDNNQLFLETNIDNPKSMETEVIVEKFANIHESSAMLNFENTLENSFHRPGLNAPHADSSHINLQDFNAISPPTKSNEYTSPTMFEIQKAAEIGDNIVNPINGHQSQSMFNVENVFNPSEVNAPIVNTLQVNPQEFDPLSAPSEINKFLMPANFEIPKIPEMDGVFNPMYVQQGQQPMFHQENLLQDSVYPPDSNVPIPNTFHGIHQVFNPNTQQYEENRHFQMNFEIPKFEPQGNPNFHAIDNPEQQFKQFIDYSAFQYQNEPIEKKNQFPDSPSQILDDFSQHIRSDIAQVHNGVPQQNFDPLSNQQFAYQPQAFDQSAIPNYNVPPESRYIVEDFNENQFKDNNLMHDIENILSKLDTPHHIPNFEQHFVPQPNIPVDVIDNKAEEHGDTTPLKQPTYPNRFDEL